MRGLEKEYAGRIDFVRVNVLDKNSTALINRFGFSATPELYLVNGSGKIVHFWDSEVEADELRKAFDAVLGSGVSRMRSGMRGSECALM